MSTNQFRRRIRGCVGCGCLDVARVVVERRDERSQDRADHDGQELEKAAKDESAYTLSEEEMNGEYAP